MMGQILGDCPTIRRFRSRLPDLSKDLRPLILIGEGGVGKSFLAAHIHAASPRHSAPVESLNFSNLPERSLRIGLLGAEPPELSSSRRSLLELKTTLVLKHVDCAGPFLQDKLAEALMNSCVIRPGSSERQPLLARVIFTFRNTIPLMKKRQSLTPRLIGILDTLQRIHLPPLRERTDDIPVLARYYALKMYDAFRHCHGFSVRGISEDGIVDPVLLDLLKSHYWKDNIRDLFAFIRSLMVFPFDNELRNRERLEIIKMTMLIDEGMEFSLASGLARIEHGIIDRASQKFLKRRNKIAHLLGLSERSVSRKLTLVLVLLSVVHAFHIHLVAKYPP